MNQISPKVFEYMACGAVPILFEGEYSGVLRKNINYIELKKDFSNFDEVLLAIHDEERREEIELNNYKIISEDTPLHFSHFVKHVVDGAINSTFATGFRYEGIRHSVDEFGFHVIPSRAVRHILMRLVKRYSINLLNLLGVNGLEIIGKIQASRVYRLLLRRIFK
jgi:hypothetical protein